MFGQFRPEHLLALLDRLHLADRMARCRFVALRHGLVGLLIPICDLARQRGDVRLHPILVVERGIHVLAQRGDVSIDAFAEFDRTLVAATREGKFEPPHAGLQQGVEFVRQFFSHVPYFTARATHWQSIDLHASVVHVLAISHLGASTNILFCWLYQVRKSIGPCREIGYNRVSIARITRPLLSKVAQGATMQPLHSALAPDDFNSEEPKVAVDIIKVSARSRSTAVAGAIAGVVREHNRAEVQAIGAGAVNQAIKAVAIARGYLAEDHIDVIVIPIFTEVMIDEQERTAVRMIVEPR